MVKYRIPKNLIDQLNDIKRIAKGGQKTVFEANHDKHGRIALKINTFFSNSPIS
ncbi:unnamed protein product [marine sediment metagenome]|uniref:Uncharacterized protein n=1 Tax=marine sediment metagenome TaxID=412755 RepID=X1RWI1_9ZZZZ